jgi:peroxiredoxin
MKLIKRMVGALLFALSLPSILFSAQEKSRYEMLHLGGATPDFKLKDVVSQKIYSLKDFDGKKAFLVIILCRHCPFVQHVKKGIAEVARDYANKNVGIVAISANDPVAYPKDAPESLRQMALEEKFVMPVLFDENQEVTRAYSAISTPDFFVFDENKKLVYRGQMDDARPGNKEPNSGKDLRAALDAVLEGSSVPSPQKPAIGCSIKWKSGNTPKYF